MLAPTHLACLAPAPDGLCAPLRMLGSVLSSSPPWGRGDKVGGDTVTQPHDTRHTAQAGTHPSSGHIAAPPVAWGDREGLREGAAPPQAGGHSCVPSRPPQGGGRLRGNTCSGHHPSSYHCMLGPPCAGPCDPTLGSLLVPGHPMHRSLLVPICGSLLIPVTLS